MDHGSLTTPLTLPATASCNLPQIWRGYCRLFGGELCALQAARCCFEVGELIEMAPSGRLHTCMAVYSTAAADGAMKI